MRPEGRRYNVKFRERARSQRDDPTVYFLRNAVGRTFDEEPRFVGIGLQQIEQEHSVIAACDSDAEVIGLSGFRVQIVQSNYLRAGKFGLPTRAKMMLARLDRRKEVGVSAVRAHPRAIHGDPDGEVVDHTDVLSLHEVDQGLSGVIRRQVLPLVIEFYVEVDVGGSARILGLRKRNIGLRPGGRCK